MVIDPSAYHWQHQDWRGRPWSEAVIYELHIGSFTPDGTFAGAIERLPNLSQLGVTAIELMPLADFRAGGTGATTASSLSLPTAAMAHRTSSRPWWTPLMVAA